MRRPLACALVATYATAISCAAPPPLERTPLKIAGGPKDATFYILANALATALTTRVSTIDAHGLETQGTSENIYAVETGAAECGLVSADLVYNAYVRGTPRMQRPHQSLRGIAVLFPNTLHLVTRGDSRLTALSDLSAKRLAAALPGDFDLNRRDSRLEALAAMVAELSPTHVRPVTLTTGMDEAVGQLEAGSIDAAVFAGGFPFRPVSAAARRYGIHLLEFDEEASGLVKAHYPFLKPVVVPAHTYPGQDRAVRTVAVDNVLICHADLPADLVYLLTRALYSSLPEIASAHPSASQIDSQNGASTPIPLHDGASRFYREREVFR